MAYSLARIEDEALQLPDDERARLALRLIESLDETCESGEDIEKLWIAEAIRRLQELRDGTVEAIPADEVFAELRAKLSK